jgi:hypothetical protein
MFKEWDNFYLLIGGAAGALIGLMFVVATLTADFASKRIAEGSRVYISPIVFHFSVVLLVSAMTAVPDLAPAAVGVLLLLFAVVGFVYAVMITIRILRRFGETNPDLSDKCFYGFFPVIAYVALGCVGASVWLAPLAAPYALGANMVVLLLIGIRNSWDLATFFVLGGPNRGKPSDP